jgi:hypothetical protein
MEDNYGLSIRFLYDLFKNKKITNYNCYISLICIINETIYDLLVFKEPQKIIINKKEEKQKPSPQTNYTIKMGDPLKKNKKDNNNEEIVNQLIEETNIKIDGINYVKINNLAEYFLKILTRYKSNIDEILSDNSIKKEKEKEVNLDESKEEDKKELNKKGHVILTVNLIDKQNDDSFKLWITGKENHPAFPYIGREVQFCTLR